MEMLIVLLVLYFVPSLIAMARKHSNIAPVLIINLFFGWTIIGWIVSLAWAFTDNVRAKA